jgi:acyl dehydratase
MTSGYFFDDLYIGCTITPCKTITEADVLTCAAVSLDTNPDYLDAGTS